MGKYEYTEHTADIGITAEGDTLGEAFGEAALGMFGLMVDLDSVVPRITRKITVTAADLEELLFEWLNTLLYNLDTEKLLLSQFRICRFDDTSLTAECSGEPYDAERHEIKTVVKSATFHDMQIDAVGNRVHVILDV